MASQHIDNSIELLSDVEHAVPLQRGRLRKSIAHVAHHRIAAQGRNLRTRLGTVTR